MPRAKKTETITEPKVEAKVEEVVEVVDSIEDEPFEASDEATELQAKYPNATVEKKGSMVIVKH